MSRPGWCSGGDGHKPCFAALTLGTTSARFQLLDQVEHKSLVSRNTGKHQLQRVSVECVILTQSETRVTGHKQGFSGRGTTRLVIGKERLLRLPLVYLRGHTALLLGKPMGIDVWRHIWTN